MIRLLLNPSYEDLLAASQLANYTSVMSTDAGTIVEQNDQRDVRRLSLGEQYFYLKRISDEKISSAFESYLAAKPAHSKPYKEMLHFGYLRSKGFKVAEVVATGEQLRLGIPVAGFIITKEVQGRDLSRLYRDADSGARLRLMRGFDALVGKLHDCGFFGSIRLKDIICAGDLEGDPGMTLIDREVRNPAPRTATRKRILDRLSLNIRRQTQQGEVFSNEEWEVFARHDCRSLSEPVKLDPELVEDAIGRVLQAAART